MISIKLAALERGGTIKYLFLFCYFRCFFKTFSSFSSGFFYGYFKRTEKYSGTFLLTWLISGKLYFLRLYFMAYFIFIFYYVMCVPRKYASCYVVVLCSLSPLPLSLSRIVLSFLPPVPFLVGGTFSNDPRILPCVQQMRRTRHILEWGSDRIE